MLMKLFLFFCFDCEKKEEKFLLLGVMKTIIAKKKQKILVKSIKLSMQCWQKKEKEIRVGENLTTTNLLHQEFF